MDQDQSYPAYGGYSGYSRPAQATSGPSFAQRVSTANGMPDAMSSRISAISDFDPFTTGIDDAAFPPPSPLPPPSSPPEFRPWPGSQVPASVSALAVLQSRIGSASNSYRPYSPSMSQDQEQSPPRQLYSSSSQVSLLTPSEGNLSARPSQVSLASSISDQPLTQTSSSRRGSRRSSQRTRSHLPLSLSLLNRHQHSAIPEEDDGQVPLVPMLDQPPATYHSRHHQDSTDQSIYTRPPVGLEEPLLESEKQELNGTLTGGLGVGHQRPAIQLHSSSLVASRVQTTSPSPTSPRFRRPHGHDYASLEAGLDGISSQYPGGHSYSHDSGNSSLLRSLTLRRTFSAAPSRASTIRDIGQAEANRRGEPIEVIIDEPYMHDGDDYDQNRNEDEDRDEYGAIGADISLMTGPHTLDAQSPTSAMKRLTLVREIPLGGNSSTRSAHIKSEYFFPQPDWKPFSMRPTYLWFLVVLSLALAIALEVCIAVWGGHRALYQSTRNEDISHAVIFSTRFLPIIVSVVFGVMWQLTDYEVKRLEAFYQMSQPGGAPAARSINVDYVTNSSVFRPWQAFRMQHYAVMVSSFTTMLGVSLVPAFASSSMNTKSGSSSASDNQPYKIVINPLFAHMLAATLLVCAVGGAVLVYMLGRRRSGLLGDPRGLAGIAAMAVLCHILHDFRGMDVATHTDLHRRLKHQKYVLQNNSLAPNPSNPPLFGSAQRRYMNKHGELSGGHADELIAAPVTKNSPHSIFLRAPGCIGLVSFMVAVAGTVVYCGVQQFRQHDDNEKWMVGGKGKGATQINGMAVFMTALSVCVKLLWGNIDVQVRMLEPYYILSKRHAPARTLTLDYTAIPFGYLPLQAAFNRHWVMCLVGFGSVIVELLTVVLSTMWTATPTSIDLGSSSSDSISYSDSDSNDPSAEAVDVSRQSTALALALSIGFSLLILCYLVGVTVVVYMRRHHVFLPRQPNTIASALSYIHQSKMLCDFEGTSKFTTAQMEEKLKIINKTYGLGTFKGRDGQTHVGVDEEELSGDYKHGLDFNKSTTPWDSRWDRY